jgi:hypothetical protein
LRASKISTAIRRAEFDRRLDAFAADSGGGDDALPGWRRYRDLIGDDAEAKSLFVEMQRTAGELLSVAHGSEHALAAQNLLESRLREIGLSLQQGDEEYSEAEVASCLWAAADERLSLSEDACGTLFAICHQSNLKDDLIEIKQVEASENPTTGAAIASPASPLRRLVGAVIRRSDGPSAYPAMALAIGFAIDEGLAPAERTIERGAAQAPLLQYAIFAIARFGNRRHAALLESQFSNTARCAGYRADDIEHVAQVRDLALAAAIHLSGEDPRQYGFSHLQTQSQTVFAPASLGFAGDSERSAAFPKWAEFRKRP